MTANFELALYLASAGLATFPCQSSGEDRKRPCPGVLWPNASTTRPNAVQALWDKHPTGAPGLDIAKSDLLVVDGDFKDGPENGIEWFRRLCEENDHDFSRDVIVKTPSGGWHVYYRQPTTGTKLTNARGSLPPKKTCSIDIRGAGGYVLAPGAELDNGKYEYLDPSCTLDDAQPIPQWLEDILRGKTSPAGLTQEIIQEPQKPAMNRGPDYAQEIASSTRRNNAYVQRALEDECNTLRRMGKDSGRNNQLNQSAVKLGHYVGGGHISELTVRDALTAAALECGLKAMETAKTLRSGLNFGKQTPKDPPPEAIDDDRAAEVARKIVRAITGELMDAETGEIVEVDGEDGSSSHSIFEELDYELCFPDGLVGEISRWICDTSAIPQPTLALGAALTIVGTVAGRQYYGPTDAGTVMFSLGLAKSGYGKDHPLKMIGMIIEDAKLNDVLGAPRFTGATSIDNMLTRMPLKICPIDEFGAFLKRINAKRAAGHEREVSRVLREVWSKNYSKYQTTEYSQRQAEDVYVPALSIFGVSTPDEFFDGLEEADKTNGLLNRFVMFATAAEVEERKPPRNKYETPKSITEGLNAIWWPLRRGGNIGPMHDARVKPFKIDIGFKNHIAEEMHDIFRTLIKRRRQQGATQDSIFARTVEISIRIATIVAVGRSPDALVSDQDLIYGQRIALWSAEAMLRGADLYMSANENQANAQRILRIIIENGGRMSHRELTRRLNHSIRMRDMREVLESLCSSGQVSEMDEPKSNGKPGRPNRIYVAIKST